MQPEVDPDQEGLRRRKQAVGTASQYSIEQVVCAVRRTKRYIFSCECGSNRCQKTCEEIELNKSEKKSF